MLVILGIIWLAGGLIGIPLLLAGKPSEQHKPPEPGKYSDGRAIRLGDIVSLGKTEQAVGKVVFVQGSAPDPNDPECTRLATLQVGFVVRTAPDELHHFLLANPYVVLK